jgi:hypothetical protein
MPERRIERDPVATVSIAALLLGVPWAADTEVMGHEGITTFCIGCAMG